MQRTTLRKPNPYREVYKKYAETQFTLEEILAKFQNYTIYGTCDNTEIHIVDANNKEYLFLTTIGYEDDDCVPDIYQPSAEMGFGKDFDEIAHIYLDDCLKITRLNKKPSAKKPKFTLYKVLGILAVLWVILSWFEVITKNIAPNPIYSSLNIFSLLISLF